jgi:hypothetical protein
MKAHAVLIGMDGYILIPDLAAISAANERLVRAAAGAEIDALVRSGLGVKKEAVAVCLQTPTFHVLLQQIYSRGAAQSIVFGELLAVDSRDYGGFPQMAMGWLNIFPLERSARV